MVEGEVLSKLVIKECYQGLLKLEECYQGWLKPERKNGEWMMRIVVRVCHETQSISNSFLFGCVLEQYNKRVQHFDRSFLCNSSATCGVGVVNAKQDLRSYKWCCMLCCCKTTNTTINMNMRGVTRSQISDALRGVARSQISDDLRGVARSQMSGVACCVAVRRQTQHERCCRCEEMLQGAAMHSGGSETRSKLLKKYHLANL